MSQISKAAVIGAGVMGAGIAAHLANGGLEVLLLDMVPNDGERRNAIAEGAIARLLKTDPAPLMHPRLAGRITPGNTEDDLGALGEADWIIEAVIERLDIKQGLYEKIAGHRKPGAIVSSNTSTLPLAMLVQGMDGEMETDFLITHFFNPPRYMRLLEVIAGPRTRPEAVSAIREFADQGLGKSVVDCKDSPGFIANRIGTYWLQCAVVEAMDGGISIEMADAVMGRPVGIPKTGVFGLLDLVGLDLMPHVLDGLAGALPPDDAFQEIYREPELIKRMIEDGYTGRKGKGGFYRLDEKRQKEAMDLKTGKYHKAKRPTPKAVKKAAKGGLRALLGHNDPAGRYAWRVLSRTLAYAASLLPEMGDDIHAVDEAMRLGYNWKYGPFELVDQLGPAWFADKLRAEGANVPKLLEIAEGRSFYREHDGQRQYLGLDGAYTDLIHPDGVLKLEDVKRRGPRLAGNGSASIWDLGDGVLCLEFHSKMNALNPSILSVIRKAVRLTPKSHKALVIHNEASNFSVGANIAYLLVPAYLHLGFVIRFLAGLGQRSYQALKYAPFPVVCAPSGMALGGGCEVLLHCDAVQAHGETYMGLVEAAVGLIPGWGGCTEMLGRWQADKKLPGGPMPPVAKVFETVSMATVAKSAMEAKDHLFLLDRDAITMNRNRVLADAKAKALELADGYGPPERIEMNLPGASALAAMRMAIRDFRKRGIATPHDATVAEGLAGVLSGGKTDITETMDGNDILKLEREGFARLALLGKTKARIRHMLMKGKPLRN